jgi:lysozyme
MNVESIKTTLTKHEGLRLHMYQDSVGIWTIGVGHNLEDKGISERVAALMLEDDIEDAITDLERNISFFGELPAAAQEALVNLCFNMGIPRLMQFKKTLAFLKECKWEKAANELLDSRYASQVGYRAVEVAQMIRRCTSC